MTVRLATPADLETVADVLEISGESAAWPGLPGWPYLQHLLGRGRVAIALDSDGATSGMAGSIEVGRSDVRFLTDLFVRPDRQDLGLGRKLLDVVLEGATARLTFSSADPRAIALYVRSGMRPWWPLFYVAVDRSVLADSGSDAGDRALRWEPTDPVAGATWSMSWTGMDRSTDFAHYEGLPDGAGSLVRVGQEVGAVVWSNRSRNDAWRVVDHVTIAPDVDPVPVTLAALRAALDSAPGLVITIPGPHPALGWLLDHGARITDRDQYCATDPGLLDPERILPSPGFL